MHKTHTGTHALNKSTRTHRLYAVRNTYLLCTILKKSHPHLVQTKMIQQRALTEYQSVSFGL